MRSRLKDDTSIPIRIGGVTVSIRQPSPDADDSDEIRSRLHDAWPSLLTDIMGEPTFQTGRQWRWGRAGSVAAEVAGPKAGSWFDHEAGEGGGPLNFIARHIGLSAQPEGKADWARVFAWARRWLEMKPAQMPRPVVIIERHDERGQDAEDADRRYRIEKAQRLWNGRQEIHGSLALRYLVEDRKLSDTPLPDCLAIHPGDDRDPLALMVAATTADNELVAVQRIFLDERTGAKHPTRNPTKQTNGAISGTGAAVRLRDPAPGGLLVLAEGFENGLTAYQALPDAGVWVTLGLSNLAGLPVPPGVTILLLNDGDAPDSRAGTQFLKAAEKYVAAGYVVRVARAPQGSRKTDLNDLLRAEGMKAVKLVLRQAADPRVVEPSWQEPRASLEEAETELEEAMAEAVRRVEEFHQQRREHQEWCATRTDGFRLRPEPEQLAIASDMGIGKTRAALNHAVPFVTDGEKMTGRRVVYVLPSHRQISDVEGRALAHELAQKANEGRAFSMVLRWRGFDRNDPDAPGETMCRIPDTMKEVISAGGDSSDLCSGQGGTCPFMKVCGYQRQKARMRGLGGGLILMPANMLTRAVPPALEREAIVRTAPGGKVYLDERPPADLVIIDEAFHQYMVGGVNDEPYRLSLASLDRGFTGRWAVPCRKGEPPMFASDRLRYLCQCILPVLRDHPQGYLSRAALAEVFDADMAREALALVYRLKQAPRPLVEPGMSAANAKTALASVKANNAEVFRLARFFSLLVDTLEGELGPRNLSPWLNRETQETEAGPVDFIRMTWREAIHDDWIGQTPVLHLDGTMRPEIVRASLPRLEVLADVKAAEIPGGVYRRQVADTTGAYRKLVPNPRASEKDQKTQRNNVRKVSRFLSVQGRQFADLGADGIDGVAIVPMGMEAGLAAAGVENAGIRLEHYGAVAGVDTYDGVAYLAVVGRPLPPPADVERMAWALLGYVGEELTEWYPEAPAGRLMRDGLGRRAIRVYHPDPGAEAIRWLFCEAHLLQAEARARPLRRTPETPLHSDIITSVPLPLQVDELVTWRELMDDRFIALYLQHGVLPLSDGEIARCFPDEFSSRAAVEQYRRRSGKTPYEVLLGPTKGKRREFLASYRPDSAATRGPAPQAIILAHDEAEARLMLETVAGGLHSFHIAPRMIERSLIDAAIGTSDAISAVTPSAPPATAETSKSRQTPPALAAMNDDETVVSIVLRKAFPHYKDRKRDKLARAAWSEVDRMPGVRHAPRLQREVLALAALMRTCPEKHRGAVVQAVQDLRTASMLQVVAAPSPGAPRKAGGLSR